MKYSYLSKKQKFLFELIKERGPLSNEGVANYCIYDGLQNQANALRKLKRFGMIKMDEFSCWVAVEQRQAQTLEDFGVVR